MSEHNPTQLTHALLLSAGQDQRAALIEAYLLASITALKPEASTTVAASCRLADLALDSIQVVELKFGLDQVLGKELDVELIISNPTITELAHNSVRAAGL